MRQMSTMTMRVPGSLPACYGSTKAIERKLLLDPRSRSRHAFESKKPLDAVDSRIVEALVENARVAMSNLAREIGVSAPSVTERIRRLEATGIIRG